MRLPEWIKSATRGPGMRQGPGSGQWQTHTIKHLFRSHRLLTVCEEAKCPNKMSCFSKPTATFMVLGNVCTRACAFCAVGAGMPIAVDPDEPVKILEAAREMGLQYVVITSVTRDDLHDGGASHFAAVIRNLRAGLSHVGIEVLTPDFKGDLAALKTVIEAAPDVFNHNMETVRRLYSTIRPQADYGRSLDVLAAVKDMNCGIRTKSGFMLGLGETVEEVEQLLYDLRSAGCDSLTIGQYLRPTKKNHPVVEYIIPEVFDELKDKAIRLGFKGVASGPLVRSSMNAEELYKTIRN
ncbi:MAG TPA: lipoyl synthase [Dissulfurispiraceae bacterium]|nr:lipoyl synthase [Dissulfurispiraceae bacterium]